MSTLLTRTMIPRTKAAAVLAFTLYSHLAVAAPNVTALPIGTACTSYPGYDGMNAGPFIAVAALTGRAVDGIGLNAAYYVEKGHRYGYVGATLPPFPCSTTSQNKPLTECSPGHGASLSRDDEHHNALLQQHVAGVPKRERQR